MPPTLWKVCPRTGERSGYSRQRSSSRGRSTQTAPSLSGFCGGVGVGVGGLGVEVGGLDVGGAGVVGAGLVGAAKGAPLRHAPEAVTYAREKAGLTKRALAAKCGISEQLMGDIEAGRRNATPENLLKFATALNCPVVVLEAKRVTAAASCETSGANEGGEAPNSVPSMVSSQPPSGDFRAA